MVSRDDLELLIEFAPRLRRAGVLGFESNGLTVQLAPDESDYQPYDQSRGTEPPDEIISDPLKDPETYFNGRDPLGERK